MTPLNLRLTPAAQRDLDEIWDYTARTWSAAQAERYLAGLGMTFELLCTYPEMARQRDEFSPALRLHRYRSHVVIYRPDNSELFVMRVVHGRQNWRDLIDDG